MARGVYNIVNGLKVMREGRPLFVLLALLLLQSSIMYSQWVQTNGPYGGRIRSFAVNGTNLFAGNDGGVFLSTNSGASWTEVNTGLTSTDVYALALSGTNLFAGTASGGVFVSTNNGTRWTQVNTGLTNTNVSSLAVNGSNLFAGTRGGGVFLSTNSGASWTEVNSGLTTTDLFALAFSGTNLFAATNGGGVFLSTNNGTSWTMVNSGLTATSVYCLAPDLSGNLFAGSGLGAFRSTNNGGNWTAVSNGLTVSSVLALGVSGADLFAGTFGGGVFLSTNSGTNWTAVNAGLTYTEVSAFGVSGTNLFAGTSGGVYLSTNNGTSWTGVNTGMTSTVVRAFAASGTNLFAGTQGGGVFRSANDGATWAPVISGLTQTEVFALALSDTNLFAGTFGGGVFLSTNSGTSWTGVNAGLTNPLVMCLAVVDTDLFAGTFGGGAFLSTNRGASWTAVNSGLTNTTVLCLAASGTHLFAGTFGGGVFHSTNSGTSWTAVNSGLTNLNVRVLEVSGTKLFAGTDGSGAFLSTNNGTNWTAVNSGLTSYGMSAFAFSGTDLFAGTNGGVFLSTNDGSAWTQTDLTNCTVLALATDSSNHIFAATADHGVFRRRLQPLTLTKAISGMKFNDINDNGIKDGCESTIAGWKIVLRDSTGAAVDTAVTDSNGIYAFANLSDGRYTVTEIQQNGWLQTFPPPPGVDSVTISGGTSQYGINFGNILVNRSIASASWFSPSTWSLSHVPVSNEAAEIATNVIFDPPSSSLRVANAGSDDSVLTLRCDSAASLTFNQNAGTLYVLGSVQINGTIQGGNALISVGGNWDYGSSGNFLAGQSVVEFTGSGTFERNFHKVIIDAASSMSAAADVSVGDSLIVLNPLPGAFSGPGHVQRGTIKRAITQGETGSYRFESDSGYVKFKGTGTYPNAMAVTVYPDTTPTNFATVWELVLSTPETLANVLRADSVTGFSKWAIGIPRPGVSAPTIRRVYDLEPAGGSGYSAAIALRYDQTEVPPGTSEDSLRLFRNHGITVTQNLRKGWNMASVSVAVADPRKHVLYPAASSNAFTYQGHYIATDTLRNGSAYWLKFPGADTVSITGLAIAAETIAVYKGWNMIGSISSAVTISSISSVPQGMITGNVFGYSGTYVRTDTLHPGAGYWIKVNGDGLLISSASHAVSREVSPSLIHIVPTSEMPPPPPGEYSLVQDVPKEYALAQSYPNPFNPTAMIRFALPTVSKVTLKIYNLLGQVVSTLVDQTEQPGYQQVEWNASSFTSGVYFYRIEATDVADPSKSFTSVKSMLLLK